MAATGGGAAVAATGRGAAMAATGIGAAMAATGSGAAMAATGRGAAMAATGIGAAMAATGRGAAVAATGGGAAVAATGSGAAMAATGNGAAVAATRRGAAMAATRRGAAVAATGGGAAVAATRRGAAVAATGGGAAMAATGSGAAVDATGVGGYALRMTRAKPDDYDKKTERSLAEDPWLARIGEHNWLRRGVRIAYGKDLFASSGLDNGTDRLLRLLAKPDSIVLRDPTKKLRILDLGCGAGALGVTLARGLGAERARLVLADRDRLAVWFARMNARLNGVENGEHGELAVLPAGLGYDPAIQANEAPFDLIVSNVPASAGDNGLYDLVYGAGKLLVKGGHVAIVYVIPLDGTMTGMREYHQKTYGPVELVAESRGKEHVAQILRFPEGLTEFESDDVLASWRRDEAPATVDFDELKSVPWCSVHDVPEFDTPHYETNLITHLIEDAIPAEERTDAEELLCLNPRHGMLPCALVDRRHPRRVALLSRDTLEIGVASRNLVSFLADRQREHETTIVEAPSFSERPWLPNRSPDSPRYDLITGHLNWREGLDALAATLRVLHSVLKDTGAIVVACRSGQIEGLRHAAHQAGLRDGRTYTRKGHTSVVLKPPRRVVEETPEPPPTS